MALAAKSPASSSAPRSRACRAATRYDACSTDTDLTALTVKSKYGVTFRDLARSPARTAARSPAVAYGCSARWAATASSSRSRAARYAAFRRAFSRSPVGSASSM